MTRFARAKGSKSSNERTPDDATPWEVMRDQLMQAKKESEEASKRKEAEKQRIENYENFLKDQKTQKRKATWCDFPETESKKPVVTVSTDTPPKKKKQKKNNQTDNTESENIQSPQLDQKNKLKKKKKHVQENSEITPDTSEKQQSVPENGNTEPKKKKKKKNKPLNNTNTDANTESKSEHDNSNQTLNTEGKKKKNKKGKKQAEGNENGELNGSNNSKAREQDDQSKQKIQRQKPKNKKLLVDGQPPRRKPINDRSFQLIVNGKEIELVRFDGFPIMKRDAERLEELKNNMIKKGIPKSEVQRTMKLERRRAEKALARMKRDVCYNCRKGGHNLSDCPELKSKIPNVGAADGMCFKCGSTEHRQFECKVQKDKEFRFATCFICKEPGHIARQCPDNPKGLYPNGGSCKLCGDVTHLRKDCPTVNEKKEGTSIKLQTLDSTDAIEGIEQNSNNTFTEEKQKKPKKIKF